MTKLNGDCWVSICKHDSVGLQLLEQTASELHEAPERIAVSPDELSIRSIEEKLAQFEKPFFGAAEYALQKNAGLYQRLA